MEPAKVWKPREDVAPSAHPELSLELAQTPVRVGELLLEHATLLLITIAEHGEAIGRCVVLLQLWGPNLDFFGKAPSHSTSRAAFPCPRADPPSSARRIQRSRIR